MNAVATEITSINDAPLSTSEGTKLKTYKDTSEIITFTINDLLDGASDAEPEKIILQSKTLIAIGAASES